MTLLTPVQLPFAGRFSGVSHINLSVSMYLHQSTQVFRFVQSVGFISYRTVTLERKRFWHNNDIGTMFLVKPEQFITEKL